MQMLKMQKEMQKNAKKCNHPSKKDAKSKKCKKNHKKCNIHRKKVPLRKNAKKNATIQQKMQNGPKCKKKSIKNAVAYLSLPSSIAMTDLRMMIPLGVALQAENKSSFPEDSLGRHRSLFKKEDRPRLIGGSESHLKKAPFSGKKNWTPTDTFLVEQ